MIVNALLGKSLPVYGDGSNIRDWLHVEDHVRGIEAVISRGEVGETYNIGGNEERANLDIVNLLCGSIDDVFRADAGLADRFPDAPAAKGANTSSLITMVKDRPGHDWRYAIDPSKIQKKLGWEAQDTFEKGILQTIKYFI